MKLKYYLRTLGIGIFVTTLMLMIFAGFHKMPDEQVIQRAKELGMVEAKNQVLSDLREEQNLNSSLEQKDKNSDNDGNVATIESEENNKPSGSGDIENQTGTDVEMTESGSEQTVVEPSQNPSIEDPEIQTPSTQESNETIETTDTTITESGEIPEVIEIVIVRGDSSVSVSQKLYKAGLVSSAAEYDRYLCRNRYDYNISVGTYQIPVGSTDEQIAKIITRK